MIQRAATPDDRLRLLRDCGVVRTKADDFAMWSLWGRRLVDCEFGPEEWQVTARLTEKGKRACKRLGPFA